MQTVQVTEFGAPSVLKCFDIPVPVPGNDEVLVKINSAGINPIDWKTRRGIGFTAGLIKDKLPWTLGYELSGVIEETGKGVESFRKGDAVFGMVGLPERSSCYAEYTTASPGELWYKPKNLTHDEAAGIPLAALTAWQALNIADVKKGDRVLIHAAAGGVGHFAVQFAKIQGAYVIGTASAKNHRFLSDKLGIDEFIDYTKNKFEDCTQDIDIVIDNIGGETGIRSLKVLRKRGVIVSLPTITAKLVIDEAAKLEFNGIGMVVKADQEDLHKITQLIEEERVRINIDSVFTLDEAAKAHEKLELGHARGKIVLSVAD
ncbi:MAG: NADP-dependent oxidoreductase [bacterium]|nr:NADP-dependent oxidoreductase [bacterium]